MDIHFFTPLLHSPCRQQSEGSLPLQLWGLELCRGFCVNEPCGWSSDIRAQQTSSFCMTLIRSTSISGSRLAAVTARWPASCMLGTGPDLRPSLNSVSRLHERRRGKNPALWDSGEYFYIVKVRLTSSPVLFLGVCFIDVPLKCEFHLCNSWCVF